MDENYSITSVEAYISRYLEGDLAPEAGKKLEAWMEKSPENMAFFEEIKSVWEKTGSVINPHTFDTNAAWEKVSAKMSSNESGKLPEMATPVVRQMPIYQKTWFQIAAAILILAAISFLWQKANPGLEHPQEMLVTESEDARRQLTLEDGTRVLLNKNSKLSYSRAFAGNERVVQLQGEAFFEVTKNPEKPFLILTPKGKVSVLGTSFSVRAIENEEAEEVYVKTGKVRFAVGKKDGTASVILTAGETGTSQFAQKSISKKFASGSHAIAWMENKLVFDRTPLPDAILAAERFYQIEIDINPTLSGDSLTGTYGTNSQQFLDDMVLIFGLELKKDNGKFILE